MAERFKVGDRVKVTVPMNWEYAGTVVEVDGGTPLEPTQYRIMPDEGMFVTEMTCSRWVEEVYCSSLTPNDAFNLSRDLS